MNLRKFRRVASIAALILLTNKFSAHAAGSGRPAIVLVHAALMDGSSWNKVIAILQRAGLRAIAVQNPLTSLGDDVAATERVIAAQDGPVVLVGHSWGGSVITQAGANGKVKALVYVAATAPAKGQSVADLFKNAPPTPGGAEIKPDAAGYLTMSPEGFVKDFAPDLPPVEAGVLAVSQAPIAGKAFAEPVTAAAWQAKPSWYIVAGQDRMMPAELERSMAATIKAKTVTIPASHALILSHPQEVAATIIEAANSVGK
jgi:pimeloyl-ACP methyl ester carboxylesterase